ncbi:hypothetical protein [Sorangium sp. So ce131]|uniref:hypothetical protein n=1 Tax=Sorangium sp. So ce131 TaxID=3133282 RepID=UPI003F640E80
MLPGDDRDHEQADDLVFAEELPLEMMGKQAQTLVERSGHEANRRTTSPKAGAAIAAALRVLPAPRMGLRGSRRAERRVDSASAPQDKMREADGSHRPRSAAPCSSVVD